MAFFIAHMESIDKIILNNPAFPSHGPGIPIPNRHFGNGPHQAHYSFGVKNHETWSTSFLRGRNHVGILQPRNASSCSLRFCSIACRRYIVGNMTFGVELYGQKLFARHFFALAVAHVIHLQEMAPENLPQVWIRCTNKNTSEMGNRFPSFRVSIERIFKTHHKMRPFQI